MNLWPRKSARWNVEKCIFLSIKRKETHLLRNDPDWSLAHITALPRAPLLHFHSEGIGIHDAWERFKFWKSMILIISKWFLMTFKIENIQTQTSCGWEGKLHRLPLWVIKHAVGKIKPRRMSCLCLGTMATQRAGPTPSARSTKAWSRHHVVRDARTLIRRQISHHVCFHHRKLHNS